MSTNSPLGSPRYPICGRYSPRPSVPTPFGLSWVLTDGALPARPDPKAPGLMRLIVTGGRQYGVSDQRDSADVTASATEERATLTKALNAFHARHGISVLIHGAATGADSLAREWASAQRIATIPFRADWKRRGAQGGAGAERAHAHRR